MFDNRMILKALALAGLVLGLPTPSGAGAGKLGEGLVMYFQMGGVPGDARDPVCLGRRDGDSFRRPQPQHPRDRRLRHP